MARVIYMDNHATTPMDPRVLEAMLPYFTEKFGNAASRNHQFGWEAEAAVDHARDQIARPDRRQARRRSSSPAAPPSRTTWPSRAWSSSTRTRGNHVITAVTEHKAILDTCKALERSGKAQVTYLPVDQQGLVDPADVRKAITDKTILISIMYANNEIGTHSAAARDRQDRQGEGRPLPQRRDAGRRQDPGRCGGAWGST